MQYLDNNEFVDLSFLGWELNSCSTFSPLLDTSIPTNMNLATLPQAFPNMYCMQPEMYLPSTYPPMQLVRAEIRERSDNWSVEETEALLKILIANKKRFNDIRRHPGLWAQIAAEMGTKGYCRSVDKCKNRWKVLVAKYKKNPRHHPDKFEFFDQMSILLHDKLTTGPASLIQKFKISS
ncbi:hypothetical protein DSO57_1028222 [Entomophthora muscae]|uniref:Uncharacterized protein n=1 Tax=Entomophthora muscae TaxID=34485 RepID=A0ACC2TZS2_9FUNG|nr:hypothetical protein DSO57_1028222 [Entomophthora muscae]